MPYKQQWIQNKDSSVPYMKSQNEDGSVPYKQQSVQNEDGSVPYMKTQKDRIMQKFFEILLKAAAEK